MGSATLDEGCKRMLFYHVVCICPFLRGGEKAAFHGRGAFLPPISPTPSFLESVKKGEWRKPPRDGLLIAGLSEAKELRCFAPLSMTTTGRMELFNTLFFVLFLSTTSNCII
jgi:hypothetical protein